MATTVQIEAALEAYIAARAAAHAKRYCIAKAIEAAENARPADTQIPTVCPLCKEPTAPYPNPPFKISYCVKHEAVTA